MTEQLQGSPIMNIMPNGPADGGGRDGYGLEGALAGILPLAFLAPLLRGFGRDGEGSGRSAEVLFAEGMGDLRQEVEGVKSGIRETIFTEALNNANKFGVIEKETTAAKFESKIATLEATNKIENKIGECCAENQKAVSELEHKMDNKFCGLEHMIESKFTQQEIENKNEKIRALEARIAVQDTVTAILTAIGLPSPIVPLAKKSV